MPAAWVRMIDPEVSRLVRERIGPRMEERRRLVPRRILVIENDMATRGLGQSSIRTQVIQEACEQEVAARIALSWTELKNILRSEEHTSELQSPDHPVCRLLLEKKNNKSNMTV